MEEISKENCINGDVCGDNIQNIADTLPNEIKTPYFLIDEKLLRKNLALLRETAERVKAEGGRCKILLAQKAFSMFSVYPILREYLDGTTASGLFEAKLGRESFAQGSSAENRDKRPETHVYSPAYREDEFDELLSYADHFVFNSPVQLEKFAKKAKSAGKSVGLRINPEFSTQEHAIYDPCSFGSRLGTKYEDFEKWLQKGCQSSKIGQSDASSIQDSAHSDLQSFGLFGIDQLDGLHIHTLCEQDSDALESTVEAFEKKFGKYLYKIKWLNLGGGHHITRPGYDIDRLVRIVVRLCKKYDVEVYLEPGEAVVLNAGFLVSSVLETMKNGIKIAILDTSAACHMPDVIEMPYQPPIVYPPQTKFAIKTKFSTQTTSATDTVSASGVISETDNEVEKTPDKNLYRLAGPSCLAGDVIGDYEFKSKLTEGDKVIFGDMALYTMVKTNTFNGIGLPSIVFRRSDGKCKLIKSFGYEDFKNRLS